MANPKSKHPVDVAVGLRVRTLRMQRGWSQERLGKALGLTFQQVQKYEKGINRIGPSRLEAIAQELDAPIEYFFGKQDGRHAQFEATGQAMVVTSEGNYIARRWERLTPGHRKMLKLIVAVLSKDSKAAGMKLA